MISDVVLESRIIAAHSVDSGVMVHCGGAFWLAWKVNSQPSRGSRSGRKILRR